ncbi:TIM barrel protein [candidate division KSB1 bacterium]|nr:TIM barrel protein [candidate division KSB1 bacterium]RQW07881.1 MAG: twin-arginine translocation signal domain-containing protein [candidate division KSB1 bacterium]
MTLNRRNFLKATGALAGTIALGGLTACKKRQPAEAWPGFKYAMCNESMRELSWAKQCQIIAEAGYAGVEIAAFTLVQQNISELNAARRTSLVNDMRTVGIECVGLHWLLAPPPQGLHFTTPDAAVREKTVQYVRDLVDFCSDLGGTVMVFGSPKQRNAEGITVAEAKKYYAQGLATVADYAQSRGVQILIEPLDRSQTDVINTLAEAKAIIDEINHPAIQTMFDFHNTPDETEPFDVLVKEYYPYIKHIHVQEMDGKHLGQGDAVNQFVKTFQLLKDLQYDNWISLEVFDFTPGGATIADESMAVLKQIEAKLI